jgi:hypothetical protein
MLSSCLQDECEEIRTYNEFVPVTVNAESFRHAIEAEGPRTLCDPGQIYYFQDYLYIQERGDGLHIIDNADPANPTPITFLPIEGVESLAIRNGILYANQYVDIVTFDVSNPAQPRYLDRAEDVFRPYSTFVNETGQQMLTVEYRPTEVTRTVECGDPRWGMDFFWTEDVLFAANEDVAVRALGASSDQQGGGSGIGGSLARFTIAEEHLYTVDEYSLHAFSLQNPQRPERSAQVQLSWDIETVFPYGDKLFIGSRSGMYIMDLADPLQPEQLGYYQHANACDPVYVQGDRAYVTLRDGTECQDFTNQLDVVDISDLRRPELVVTHPMHRPIGLSIHEQLLFICDDDQGLKVFDASDDFRIGDRLLDRAAQFQATDVITLRSKRLAMVVGADGLIQLQYDTDGNLTELSRLQVCVD